MLGAPPSLAMPLSHVRSKVTLAPHWRYQLGKVSNPVLDAIAITERNTGTQSAIWILSATTCFSTITSSPRYSIRPPRPPCSLDIAGMPATNALLSNGGLSPYQLVQVSALSQVSASNWTLRRCLLLRPPHHRAYPALP